MGLILRNWRQGEMPAVWEQHCHNSVLAGKAVSAEDHREPVGVRSCSKRGYQREELWQLQLGEDLEGSPCLIAACRARQPVSFAFSAALVMDMGLSAGFLLPCSQCPRCRCSCRALRAAPCLTEEHCGV